MSCTTSTSSFDSASRAWSASGSLIAGFSPMMYMPLTLPARMALMTSSTVRPGLSLRCALGAAVDILADPHAQEDHRSGAGGIQPRHLANRLRRAPADRRHQVRAVAGD